MSTAVLDEREQRRASVRAEAAAIADAPRSARRFSVPANAELRPTTRPRRHARVHRQARLPRLPSVSTRVRTPRRVVAAIVLLLQVGLLVLALTLPAFRVQHVSISGTLLVPPQTLLQAAAVPHQSIFTVDADAIQARLASLPWVADARVVTELPNSVNINVTERSPDIRLRRPGAPDVYVAGNGATLAALPQPASLWNSTPVLLDMRSGSPQPIDPALLQILSQTAQRFPAVFGCSVAGYYWGPDGVFSIWASTGWRAVLGHVDTSAEVAAIPGQLAALGALRTTLNFKVPTFSYINVVNPQSPTLAGSPGLPPELAAAAQPLPQAAPQDEVSAPSPTAAPPAGPRGLRA